MRILETNALQVFCDLILDLGNILKGIVEADGCLLISVMKGSLEKCLKEK